MEKRSRLALQIAPFIALMAVIGYLALEYPCTASSAFYIGSMPAGHSCDGPGLIEALQALYSRL